MNEIGETKETRVSHFGDLIRKLRKERGLSLEKAAREIRTFKSYICGIRD